MAHNGKKGLFGSFVGYSSLEYLREKKNGRGMITSESREELEKLKRTGHVDMWITDIKNM